jgi:hypothetical protein
MPEPAGRDAAIFPVDTRFHTMVRRPGGIPREQAIEAAEQHLGKLHPGFKEWLDQQLDALTAVIPQTACDVSTDDAWINPAYARCRAIRDVAATMGFYLVTFAANHLCEGFETIRSGVEYPFEIVDRDLKALLLARQEADCADRGKQLQKLLDRLEKQRERSEPVPAPGKTSLDRR